MRPLDSPATAVLWLLLGLALAAVSMWLLAVSVPERYAADRAFRTAPVCPAAARTGAADCLRRVEFVVSDVRLGRGKRGASIRARLTSPETGSLYAQFRNDGPVLDGQKDGDRVVGTLWRGDVVTIAAGGAEQPTVISPSRLSEASLGLALATGPSGLLLAFACGLRMRRRAEPRPTRGMRSLVRLAGWLTLASLLASGAVHHFGLPLWCLPVIWLPLAALCTGCEVVFTRRPPASRLR
ncbi:hypothetical protein GCM10010329_29930 [Streptomyces spiroverticillatus]|uniref:Uncharacterized protein n=1 Tax=Streptomyces finlayi TaxID=67296 RepID=A0A918WW50_9ACTN|nr:hypothetical protein GCM10010329_29930 [Streptomyces spiroverticillatus]GHC89368.1 hypothetical protein GCM10010334_22340 [Streptomyces finlayi]